MPTRYAIPVFLLFLARASGQDISKELDEYLSKPERGDRFNGTALIVYKGQTLLHKGYGYQNFSTQAWNDTNTMYRIGSLTKPLTATVILYLAQEGRLKLSDPLSKYIGDYPNGANITIENLLTHSSGIADYLFVKRMRQIPDSAPPIPLDTLINFFKWEKPVMGPGEKWSYSNSNYILLSYIIEKATGKKFETFERELIFDRLAMNHSGFDFKHLSPEHKARGYTNFKKNKPIEEDFDSSYAPGCGAMFTTTGDLYKFYRGLMQSRIIGESLREIAFQPKYWKYGYGWFVYELYGRKSVSHAGGVPGFYSNLQFFPNEDLFIVILSNNSLGHIETDKIASIVFHQKFQSSGL